MSCDAQWRRCGAPGVLPRRFSNIMMHVERWSCGIFRLDRSIRKDEKKEEVG